MALTIRQHMDLGNIARVTNLGAPIDDNDAVRKIDLSSAIEGTSWKDAVRVATQSNINIASPGGSIDGITLVSGDRVLVKAQTTDSENGIYVFNTGASPMVRSIDTDSANKLEQAVVAVEEGSSASVTYRQTQVNFVLDFSSVLWTTFGNNAGPASETSSGIAEIATQAEVDGGLLDDKIVTPLKLAASPFAVNKYTAQFGDGTTTNYTITHNIGSRNVFAKVFKTAAPYGEIMAQIEYDSDNTISIEFAEGNAPANNEYTVAIIG